MTLTFTGAQFEVEFYAAMYAWVARNKQGPDPRTLWEHAQGGDWLTSSKASHFPSFHAKTYRWKPAPKRMVKMYDCDGKPHDRVAPEVDTPAHNWAYFHKIGLLAAQPSYWQDLDCDRQRLADGLVFLNAEDAQAMATFQRMQRGVK